LVFEVAVFRRWLSAIVGGFRIIWRALWVRVQGRGCAAEGVKEFHGFLGLTGLIQGFPMAKKKDAELI